MEGRRKWKKINPAKMERCRSWLWFRESFLFPTKTLLLKLASSSRKQEAKGNGNGNGNGSGLVSLHKDIESCGEYADIQVMWEIIHSYPQATPSKDIKSNRSSSYWRFCFQPT